MRQLILGGVRSGKSRLAETLATETGLPVTYLATAQIWDDEMAARIRQHQQYRPVHWTTVEIPDASLPQQLADLMQQPGVILLDCLTLWLTQLLCAEPLNEASLARVDQVVAQLVDCVAQDGPAELILVGNETGLGIMPVDRLSRIYGDKAGLLHQQLAQVCERVVLTVAGLPLVVKGSAF